MAFKKKEDLVFEKIDNEYIIFDPYNEAFFEFNGVASLVWEVLESLERDDIVQKVCTEYAVDEKTALRDVSAFFDELINMQLIYRVGKE